jgi:hypothetical protein
MENFFVSSSLSGEGDTMLQEILQKVEFLLEC